MTDLRKAAQAVVERWDTPSWKDVPATAIYIEALRQALAQPEQEAFTLDRGCWERGCMAYDTRDGDGVIVYVDPVNMSQECVDETAKCGHEAFYRLLRIMGTFDLATGHADSWNELLDSLESELRDVLGHLRTRREWVGLTKLEFDIAVLGLNNLEDCWNAIEAKLKEKNT